MRRLSYQKMDEDLTQLIQSEASRQAFKKTAKEESFLDATGYCYVIERSDLKMIVLSTDQ